MEAEFLGHDDIRVVVEDDKVAVRIAAEAVMPVPVPVVVPGGRGYKGMPIAVPVVVPGGRGCKGRPVVFVCLSIFIIMLGLRTTVPSPSFLLE